MTYLYCFLLTLFAFNCANPKKISIIPFTVINYSDSIKNQTGTKINKIDYFLVSNYIDNKRNEFFIDTFAINNKNSDINQYSLYKMIFYKESSKTSIKNISENPRDIIRYSQDHDLIYEYSWMSGKFLAKHKFKNGEIIEPKNKIKIEDILN